MKNIFYHLAHISHRKYCARKKKKYFDHALPLNMEKRALQPSNLERNKEKYLNASTVQPRRKTRQRNTKKMPEKKRVKVYGKRWEEITINLADYHSSSCTWHTIHEKLPWVFAIFLIKLDKERGHSKCRKYKKERLVFEVRKGISRVSKDMQTYEANTTKVAKNKNKERH